MRVPALDDRQREAVDWRGNAVVSAGAGSGKTTVLAERYLKLVKEGRADIEEILTLTYTRKAAAEMYERIYARLVEEADPTIKEQLARFDRAQISTLDSFCVQVVRNSPQYFGLRSDFSLGEEESLRLAEETALSFLLDHSDDPALAAFVRLNGFERVWREFFASLGTSYLHLAERRDFPAIYRRQVDALRLIVDRAIGEMQRLAAEIGRLDGSAAKAIAGSQASLRALPDLAGMAAEERFEEIAAAAAGFRFNRRTGGAKSETVAAFKALADEFDERRGELARAGLTLASREMLRRLFELCGEYEGLLLRRKRASGALSFRDVVEMAVKLLTDNVSLRRHYKHRYRYLMIDEFQDNNELQKRLLYLLAEREGSESPGPPGAERVDPAKLFFVGDEKQSIYRFRGADVAVFRNLSEELGRSGGRAISLATNYRSAPRLIDFYNRFFAALFADSSEEYEARFESLLPGPNGATASSIRLFHKPYRGPAKPDEAHSDDAEAYHIALFIKDQVEKRSFPVRDGAGERPADWGDFALLMRTTSNQIRYERIFRRLGIPYTTQSVRTLFLEAPLNDLYSALQLVVYPDDRSAYASLLRSPLVNLTDASVLRILLQGGEPFAALPETIDPSGEDAARFSAGRELYRHLCNAADFTPIASLIDDLWFRFGYRYTILKDAANHPYLEYYDYFRKLADDTDRLGGSLSEFLDHIRPNLGKYEKLGDLEVVRDQRPGVQLLTVHKAKGLEFPIVILANSGNLGRSRGEGNRPYYLSDEYGLTIRVTERGNYFYQDAEEENRRKANAELKRLLYVALTRAQSHLIISGCHNKQNRTSDEVLLNMIMKTLGLDPDDTDAAPSPSIEVVTIPALSQTELQKRQSRSSRGRIASVLKGYRRAQTIEQRVKRSVWTATELSALVWERIVAPSTEGGLFPELPEGLAAHVELPTLPSDPLIEEEDAETVFGSLVHALIAGRLSGAAYGSPDELPPRLLRGLPRNLLAPLFADAQRLAEGFLGSGLGQRATAGKILGIERTFLFQPDQGLYIRGAFDLLFTDAEGVCVVDFKSDRELQPAAHAPQLHAYRLAAGRLTGADLHPGGRSVTACLFYLRGARAVEVDERVVTRLYRYYLGLTEANATGAARPPQSSAGEPAAWTDGGASLLARVLTTLVAGSGAREEREAQA